MKRVSVILLCIMLCGAPLTACTTRQAQPSSSASDVQTSVSAPASETAIASASASSAPTASSEAASVSAPASSTAPSGTASSAVPTASSAHSQHDANTPEALPAVPPAQSGSSSENTAVSDHVPEEALSITPAQYQARLGKGMNVDWSKTNQGRKYYRTQAAADFAQAGISHVRIRIADEANQALWEGLDRQIADCLANGIIPVIAYQADALKNNPSEKNIQKVVDWWGKTAAHYRTVSPLLSFDLLIEVSDSLNQQPNTLNDIYERTVTEIRKTNPTRILMISPRLRSDAAYLRELKIPSKHNGYLMAEWHFYASGPSKTNERKRWTTGTQEERDLLSEKIDLALAWQSDTGIPTWVGAWMPGNYNDGDSYTVEEQVVFAQYMTEQLTAVGIPFAVNSDTKFYDRETGLWISEMQPVFSSIYR